MPMPNLDKMTLILMLGKTEVRNALNEAIDIIAIINSKIFENRLLMNYSLKERSAFGMYYTKSVIKSLLNDSIYQAKFLYPEMEKELREIINLYDNNPERYICIKKYRDRFIELAGIFIESSIDMDWWYII